MKTNLLKSLFISVALFVFLLASPTYANAAAKIYFDPSTYTTSQGSDLTVKVQVDTGTEAIVGVNTTIQFDPTQLTLKSVSNGGYFSDSDFTKANGSDSIEIKGLFQTLYQTKTGTGTFATIVFTPVKTSGSATVSFACDGDGNDTFILDANGANILTNCSTQTNQLNLNFGSGSQQSNPTDNPTNAGGPTNACGGTCGSHYNCNAGLFCSNGFCRNPDCPSDLTCGCKATPKPASKVVVKTTPKPSVKPTPQVIALKKYTPAPLVLPTEKPADEVANAPKVNLKAIAMWSGIALLLLLIASMIKKYLAKHKGKNLPPNIPSSPPPMMPPPFLPPDMGPPTPPTSSAP